MKIENDTWKNEIKIKMVVPNWIPDWVQYHLQDENGCFSYFGAMFFLIAYYVGWATIFRNGEQIDFYTYVDSVKAEHNAI